MSNRLHHFLATFILFLFGLSAAFAQCPPGSITLLTQAEVDQFAVNYPGCTNLQGGLIIGPSSDISNLNGLASIIGITSALTIQGNDALTDMSGLSSLSSIGTAIYITGNPVLESIDLHNVGGSLSVGNLDVINNDVLTSLAAPELLTMVNGRVNIFGNPDLVAITGLESLVSIGGELQISGILEDQLPDFSNLTHIGTNIIFQNNANVTTINLQNVTGSLSGAGLFLITNNGSLTHLAAPEQLTSINGKLNIFGNPDLVAITGLESLVSIGGELQISGILEDQLPDFSNLTHIGTNIIFQNNANVTTINLQNVTGSLSGAGLFLITNNGSLTHLAAPEQLTSINGKLNIFGNPDLVAITGLESLVSIGGELQLGNIPATNFPEMFSLNTIGTNLIISSNSSIENLNWISNLISIGGVLNISNNALLSDCAIDAVCYFLVGSGIRSVVGNTGCCFNEPILTDACDNVSSGTEEVCDGADNNCDGQIDEGFDLDNDGFTSCGGDCDDNDPNNYPGNEEVCDGADNNCDGQIDEGFDGDNDGIADCFDNCPGTPNPDQADSDCDGVGDVCDQWPGCDDSLDSDNDGIPDCVDLDELDNWTCSNNGKKTYICHIPPGNHANQHTICISKNAVSTHLNNHGDYIGECYQIACSNSNLSAPAGYTESSYSFSDEIVLYPNPTSGFISLDVHHYLEQKISLTIYNQMGQEVMSVSQREVHTPVLQLDLAPQLPDGVYLLAIQTDETRLLKQFVLSRGK